MRLALVCLVLTACPPSPTPGPMPPDASDASLDACSSTCAQLAAMGCAEGKAYNCAPVLRNVQNARIMRNPDKTTGDNHFACGDPLTPGLLGVIGCTKDGGQ